jgi:phosphate uptake regulator
MARNSSKPRKAMSKVIRARLSDSEYETIMENIPDQMRGSISNYVRNVLLNRKIRTEIYDSTGDNVTMPMYKLVAEIKKIGVNYNQIARQIHTNPCDKEVKNLLPEAMDLMRKVFIETKKIEKIADHVLDIYDCRNGLK